MNNLLDVIVFQNVYPWILLSITVLALASVPRLFGLNYINGLSFAQLTLFFNAVPIISGLDTDAISIGRGLHFYTIEFSFLILVFATYRHLLMHRVQVLSVLRTFFDGNGAFYLVAFMISTLLFNYAFAPSDGTSRIKYMTDAWYSFVKPFIHIGTPLSFLGIFIMLANPRRRFLGYILLVSAIGASIVAGSKAGFTFSLATAFLMLRDIAGTSSLKIRHWDYIKISVLIAASVVFAITRLNVSIRDILDRFLLFADATILTYFSDNPTAACANVSTFASMHRGWARLMGDPSAMNIDTLFGYALTIQELGLNTFTGPNGRFSAYILCNFSDGRIFLGAFVIAIYIWLILRLYKRLLQRPTRLALVYPFLVLSLGGASQDFNLIMQDITLFVLLFLTTLTLYPALGRRRFE